MSSAKKDEPNRRVLSEEDESCVQAMLFAQSHVFPMVLNAAIELSLFDIIAQAGAYVSPSEIASRLPTRNPSAASLIDRMLRLFASHSLLSCSLQTLEDGRVERLYGLTPACRHFLRSTDDGSSLALMVAHSFHPSLQQVWLNLKDAVLEGGNLFERVHGMNIVEYREKDWALSKGFSEGMARRSTVVMKKIMEIYNGFEGLASLVDVGGGTGACLNLIVSKYPSIKAINFDLPHVVQIAPNYPAMIVTSYQKVLGVGRMGRMGMRFKAWADAFGLQRVISTLIDAGIEHVGGSMLVSIPKADAIMMKSILHNWSDEHCSKILSNCCEALPKNGKVIVIEKVMPEAPDSSMGSQYITCLDNAMITLHGGKERTGREFDALCKSSGFSDFRVVCCAYGCLSTVMEFHK